ncbi:hypothetical protein BH10ACI3_BH10ACI3_04330 [soil metagenome]
MGQPDRALVDLNRLIEISPEYYYYSDRAEVLSQMGKYDEALRDHAEAIRLKPGRGELYAKRALTYRRMNNAALAEADEAKVRELTASPDEKADAEQIINEKAVDPPKPEYPAAARATRAAGQVRVRVETDAKGVVTSATAVSGHPLLKAAAESAARQTKFKEPSVKGILVFDFLAA